MRPYLAVIRDSFREAFATRVLWIMLILIGVLLGLLAPLGFEKALAVSLQFSDFQNPQTFIKELRDNRNSTDTPAGYVWSRLSDGFKSEVSDVKPDTDRRRRMGVFGRARNEINRLFNEPDFYNEDVWEDIRLGSEANDLLEQGLDLRSEEERRRFNRLAFEAAFPKHIEASGRDAIQFVYLWYPLGDELPIQETQLQQIGEQILSFLVSRLVGNIGVFIALLVTASIVPQMLDSGAIDLLLSKPVSRPLLFLSKFFGGCTFILLNATFLIAGLWIIVGWRFGIWSDGLLWTIPVFVFVFASYYSVSTLAAVIWRNAVVSIVVSILFWAVCFAVGLAKTSLDNWFLDNRRTATIIPARDTMIRLTQTGSGYDWDDDNREWRELFEQRRRGGPPGASRQAAWLGAYYDATNDRLVGIRSGRGSRWFRGSSKLAIATQDNDWKPQESIDVPGGVRELLPTSNGDILVTGTDGLYRLEGEAIGPADAFKLFGMSLPGIGESAKFVRVDDETLEWKRPFAAAIDPVSGRVVVNVGNTLAILKENDGQYVVESSYQHESTDEVITGFFGDKYLTASQSGLIHIFNANGKGLVDLQNPFGNNEPRQIVTSPDGKWAAVLFHHRKVFLYFNDGQEFGPASPSLNGQGDISAIAFDADSSFLAADRFGRITRYSPEESFAVNETMEPEADFLENLYTRFIDPVHTIFPKPGEMENVVTWLMTKQQTIGPDDTDELSASRQVIDIQEPLWSNLAFLVIMLTITSVLITRRDF
jgi:hypothetical protein